MLVDHVELCLDAIESRRPVNERPHLPRRSVQHGCGEILGDRFHLDGRVGVPADHRVADRDLNIPPVSVGTVALTWGV